MEKSLKFYNKIKCKFDIKQHTFHNIFKSWKANTKLYTKFSVLENCLTRDNKQYLKDYNYNLIYNQNGKQQFIHEHMIFISNFFIRKLNQTNHWFIDRTFVYPSDFSQLIVILYRDINNWKNYPGLFALINNKKRRVIKCYSKKSDIY